jgi:alkyl sulfatase BDS1-like metallo-beta-lactamase superfamily hydrolase
MPLNLFFDYLGVRLNSAKAAGKTITINWSFTDTSEKYVLTLESSVLNHTPNKHVENADTTITLTRKVFNELILRQASPAEKVASGEIKIEGNPGKLNELFSLLDQFDPWFNIVTP